MAISSKVFWGCFLSFLFGCAILLSALWAQPGADESLFLMQSKIIALGGRSYIDFFQCLLPFMTFWGGWIFKCFGPSVIAARISMQFVLLASIWMGASIARPYFRPWTQILWWIFGIGCIIANCTIFSHHILSGAFALGAVYAMIRHLRSPCHRLLFSSGFFAGLALLTTETIGILIFGVILIFLVCYLRIHQKISVWWDKRTDGDILTIGYFLLGWIAPLLGCLLVLLIQGSLGEAYRDVVLYLTGGYFQNSTVSDYFTNGGQQVINLIFATGFWWDNLLGGIHWNMVLIAIELALIAWLPVLGCLWALQTLLVKAYFQCRNQSFWEILLLLLASLACLMSTLSYSTAFHIAVVAWPAYLLAFIGLQSWAFIQNKRWTRFRFMPQVMFFALLLVLSYSVLSRLTSCWMIMQDPRMWEPSFGTVEKRFFSLSPLKTTLTQTAAIYLIRKNNPHHRPIFVYNASPELYLLSGFFPVGRYFFVFPSMMSPDQVQELQHQLETVLPPVIVYDKKWDRNIRIDPRFIKYADPKYRLKALEKFISLRYELLVDTDLYQIYRIKTQR